MNDTTECSRCGAMVVHEPFDNVKPLHLALDVSDPGEKPDYQQEMRSLCEACERDLLEWIDEGDIDRSDCVDLPSKVQSARSLTRTAEYLEEVAEQLQEDLDTDD